MTNTLPISELNMMMKYAIVLKICSVGESGSYVHRDAVELEFVTLFLVFMVRFGKESAIDKKEAGKISQIVNSLLLLSSQF